MLESVCITLQTLILLVELLTGLGEIEQHWMHSVAKKRGKAIFLYIT
jgi:hypothetical protein